MLSNAYLILFWNSNTANLSIEQVEKKGYIKNEEWKNEEEKKKKKKTERENRMSDRIIFLKNNFFLLFASFEWFEQLLFISFCHNNSIKTDAESIDHQHV